MWGNDRISTKQKLPGVLNTEQIVKIFDTIDRPKVAIATAIGFFCGLRISEVAHLKISNIDIEKKRLKVENSKYYLKNISGYGKDRYVPIPDVLISPLKKWIDIMGGGTWLFSSYTSPNEHMSKKTLGSEFREFLNRAGFNQVSYHIKFKSGPNKGIAIPRYKFHFHTLRHSYATYLLEKGVDLYTISSLLGHNQVSTTQIYARISDKQRVEAVRDAFSIQMSSRVQNIPQSMQVQNTDRDIEILRLQLQNKELELKKLELMQKLKVPVIEIKNGTRM